MFEETFQNQNGSKGFLPDSQSFLLEDEELTVNRAFTKIIEQYNFGQLPLDNNEAMKAIVKSYLTGIAFLKHHAFDDDVKAVASCAWDILNKGGISFVVDTSLSELEDFQFAHDGSEEDDDDDAPIEYMELQSEVFDDLLQEAGIVNVAPKESEDPIRKDGYLDGFTIKMRLDFADDEEDLSYSEIKVGKDIEGSEGILLNLDVFLISSRFENPINLLASIAKSCARIVNHFGMPSLPENHEDFALLVEAKTMGSFYEDVMPQYGLEVDEILELMSSLGLISFTDYGYYSKLFGLLRKNYPEFRNYIETVKSVRYGLNTWFKEN